MIPPSKFASLTWPAPQCEIGVAANTLLPLGNLVATDGSGNAVLAADTAGLTIVGIARGPGGLGKNGPRDMDVDNTGGRAGAQLVSVRAGIYRLMNSSSSPVTPTELGKVVYVEDERTVAKTTTSGIVAGVVIGLVGSVQVWLCVGPIGTLPGSPSLGSV